MLYSYGLWGVLEMKSFSAIMLPSHKAPRGLIRGGFICKDKIVGGGLFGGGNLFEDLRHVSNYVAPMWLISTLISEIGETGNLS